MAKIENTPSSPVNADAVDPGNAAAWEEAQKQAKDAGINWERPEGDNRTAQEIIDENPLLANLGNQSGVRDSLELQVGGDIDTDADAAYRASQVLEHIEQYDDSGTRVAGKDLNNGKIDGFDKKGRAGSNTEAGRLQDFGKYGFSSLQGALHNPATVNNEQARKEAEALGIDWERPEGDTRTAEDIIKGDPLLQDLGNQSGVSDMIKERVGDYTTDADAAYRASQVLRHVEQYDEKGNEITKSTFIYSDGSVDSEKNPDIGDGKINGFTKSGEAEAGSEAGRLQDFGKYGFSALSGNLKNVSTASNKVEDLQSYQDYLKANPDADDGSKLVAKYGAILEQNYETIMQKAGTGEYMDADTLKRYTQNVPNLDQEVKEALDFWSQPGAFDMLDVAGNPITHHRDGKVGTPDIQAWMKASAPKDSQSFMAFLTDTAQRSAFADVDTSNLGADVFQNPGNYSAEQKAAVLLDLEQTRQLMVDGVSAGMWKDDYSKVTIANAVQGHPDKEKLFADLDEHIQTLSQDPEVSQILAERRSTALKGMIDGNEGLKATVQKGYDDEVMSGKAFDTLWDKAHQEGGGGQQQAVTDFIGTVQTYQAALGVDNPADVKEAIKKSSHEGDLKSYYEDSLVSGDRLNELLKDNSFESAASVFNLEVALYSTALDGDFTNGLTDKLTENFTNIARENVFKDTTFEDLQKVYGVDGGSELDEAKVTQYIEEVSRENPELFINQDGSIAKPADIVAGFRAVWDNLRQGTKTLDKLGVFDPPKTGQADGPDKVKADPNDKNSFKALYDKGVLHGVSGLLLGGATIARGVGVNGTPTTQETMYIVTGSIQTATVLTEGGSKAVTQYLDKALGAANTAAKDAPSEGAREKAKANAKNLEDWKKGAKYFEEGAKGLGGAAGAVLGGYSIFSGIEALGKGDTVTGGLSVTSGTLGLMAGTASLAEGALGVAKNLTWITKVPKSIPIAAGVLGWAAAGVGVLASFLPTLIAEGQHQTRSDRFADVLGERLTKYEIDGVKDGDRWDIPEEEWPGYTDKPLTGS